MLRLTKALVAFIGSQGCLIWSSIKKRRSAIPNSVLCRVQRSRTVAPRSYLSQLFVGIIFFVTGCLFSSSLLQLSEG